MKNKVGLLGILFIFSALLFGCAEDDKTEWTESPTFAHDEKTLYGVEGKIGISRENGEVNDPDFPANQGRLYNIYFLEDSSDIIGKEAKMSATHKETGETVEINEFIVWSTVPAKFGFDLEGLWEINVTIDEKPYTIFIINVEKLK